jgi:site-specific recombinase XerD
VQSVRTFRRQVDGWLDGLESVNTRQAYRRDLAVFVAWLERAGVEPDEITGAHLVAFRTHIESVGEGAATVRRRLAAVSSFFRDHTRVDAVNPATDLERPARPAPPTHVLDADELSALWRAAAAAGGKTAVLLGLLLFDDFTTRSALAVDVADVVVSRTAVTIRVGAVVVELDPRSAAAVRRHVAGRDRGPLLLGDRVSGEPQRLTRFGVDYLVKQMAVRAGVEGPVSVGLLRRSATAAR